MSHCKFFKGDRPCKYYWIDRSWDCNNCEHHTTYDKRLLLIKLDELGDVVRSTALVEGLKNKYNNIDSSYKNKRCSKIFI